MLTVIKTEKVLAADINIAICGTNPSEYYQVDDDIWQLMEDLGANVKKVDSSVDVSKYDGLLIPGGIDIDPAMYGEEDYACNDTDISFDRQQIAVIEKFVNAGKPILGICRGFQLLNVYFGGTLIQDVSGHNSSHSITSASGSQLYEICGSGFYVSSRHHQSIKTLGSGLTATQWAPDSLIEGAEHVSLPIIGVMWHPEWSSAKGTALVRYFLFSMCAGEYEPGLVYLNGEWVYRNSNGKIDLTYTGVAQNEYGWWYVRDGKVDFSYTGIAHNSNGWWRIENGKVNFSFKGFAENENGWWYLENGRVNFNKTDIIQGTVNGESGWWHVVAGKVTFDTTVAPNSYGWWYVRDGKVDFSYTGAAENSNGIWRIENGKVNFGFSGFASDGYYWWYMESGKAQTGKNDVIYGYVNDENGWWHVIAGIVVFDTTVASNSNGWWYIRDGKVDFDHTGLAENSYGMWRIEGGKVNFGFNGNVQIDGKEYIISGGKVIAVNDIQPEAESDTVNENLTVSDEQDAEQ